MSNLSVATVPLAGDDIPLADVAGSSAPLAEVVVAPTVQVGAVEDLSLEDRRTKWRSKYMLQLPNGSWAGHRNKSSIDPFYWAQMGAERQGLWPPSASSSEPEYSDDSDMGSPPQEDQISLDTKLGWADLFGRQHECERRAEELWSALEEMHGWTALAKHTWRVAHLGPPVIVPPWQVYTRVSRDVWLVNIWPTV
jgi:hypothetical protein